MTSQVSIANKALQKIGEQFITSFTDDSVPARAVNRVYEDVVRGMLRAHPWNFAVKRVALPADVATPVWEFEAQYTLPSDFLRMVAVELNPDYTIEDGKILTNEDAPLNIAYIFFQEDPNKYDLLFVDALSGRLAVELVETLTQSNSKKAAAIAEFNEAFKRARNVDGQDQPFKRYIEDDWIIARI